MALTSSSVNNPTNRSGMTTAGNINGKGTVSAGNSLGVSEGQLVKGTVTDVRGSQITIQMDDGKTFTGRLNDASQYSIGQKAAFQVTNTSAKMILMKAVSDAYLLNSDDTIFKALEEAGLPKSTHNTNIVRALLNTQQSIGKESILNALRLCANYPESSVDSVLTMKYLSMPMTKENVLQFEQYQNKTHQLINKMDALANSVNEVLDLIGKQAPEASHTVGLQFLDLALEASDFPEPSWNTHTQFVSKFDTSVFTPGGILVSTVAPDGTPLPKGSLFVNGQLIAAEIIDGKIVLSEGADLPKELSELLESFPKEQITVLSDIPAETARADTIQTGSPAQSFMKGQIGNALSPQILHEFHAALDELPLPEQLKQDIINGTAMAKDVLTELRTILPSLPPDASGKLLSSPGFHALLKDQLLSGWTISPHALKEPENVEKLYEKLERQLETVTKFSENVLSQKAFSDMGTVANDMHQNLQFIKTLNENLAYMQLPLKLSEENAHGDLYIMTKKSAMKKHPDKLRVLLHLELEHLGTLDVHIEKDNASVKTKFYVEDKKTIRLFEKNIELLSDALVEQGYLLTNEIHLHEKEIDIVKDFIAQDVPIGDMKRYNFDLRA